MLYQGTHEGRDVMWLELDEYLLHSPPIPTDRRKYLNGDVKAERAQKFQHTPLPDKRTYYAWDRKRQQELEDQEWDRRKNGVWFFNCGQPTYLTGNHYNYLNYHRYAGDLKPDYREANLEFYWVWRHCLSSPVCYGMHNHTRRRDGKTSRAANIGLEGATRVKGFRFGMASKKGDPSAKISIYQNEVIRPLKALRACPWFMPSLVGKIDPANNLKFGARSTTSAKEQEAPTGLDDLGSEVMWFESPPNAIDSDSLTFFFNDEVAKEQDYDAYQRWMTVKPQFNPNGTIIGKGICATTTDRADDKSDEDGKKKASGTSVKQAKKFWDNSDHTQLGPGESTETGLFRLFTAAYKGFMVDEYGRDTPAGRQHFENKRKHLTGVALINEKRENPFTIEEALLEPVREDCAFNAEHIVANIEAIEEYELLNGKPLCPRYDLVWTDEVRQLPPVKAIPNPKNGPWQIPWLPPADQLNQMLPMGTYINSRGERVTRYKPLRVDDQSLGNDPVARKLSSINNKKKASKYSLIAFRPYNPWNERLIGQPGYWPSEGLVARYNARPENAETAYEEAIKYCHLVGCMMNAEKQTNDLQAKYFEDRGYGDCMDGPVQLVEGDSNRAQNGPGTAASTTYTIRWTGLISQFITDYVGSSRTVNSKGEIGINDRGQPYDFRRQPFIEVHRDNLTFNPDDTRVSDDTVAEGMAISHAYRRSRAPLPVGGDNENGIDASVFSPSQYFR